MYGHFEYMYVCTTEVKCGTIWYKIKLIRKRVSVRVQGQALSLYTIYTIQGQPISCTQNLPYLTDVMPSTLYYMGNEIDAVIMLHAVIVRCMMYNVIMLLS